MLSATPNRSYEEAVRPSRETGYRETQTGDRKLYVQSQLCVISLDVRTCSYGNVSTSLLLF